MRYAVLYDSKNEGGLCPFRFLDGKQLKNIVGYIAREWSKEVEHIDRYLYEKNFLLMDISFEEYVENKLRVNNGLYYLRTYGFDLCEVDFETFEKIYEEGDLFTVEDLEAVMYGLINEKGEIV